MSILVTGANGFVGRALCAALKSKGEKVRCAVRKISEIAGQSQQESSSPAGLEQVEVGDIGLATDWTKALKGVEVVIHLAARVHVMKERAKDPLAEYRRVNVLGTEHLARMAVAADVRRLLYVSSIKVNGEASINHPLTEGNPVNPQDPYAISKWEAECVLRRIAQEYGLEVVIIRSPLVYGPGVGGNFLRLLHWIYKGLPLPFRSINNKRSLIALENLVDILVRCIWHSNVAGETFLISDGQDVSTPDLIRMIASAMKKTTMLLPIPLSFLNFFGKIIGKSNEIEKLTGSLSIDSSKIRKMLNWKPPFTLEEGVEETVKWYRAS